VTYQIETNHHLYRNTRDKRDDWVANLDCYDGAPDTQGFFAALATAKTEMKAIEALIEQLDGEDIVIDLMAIGLDGECNPHDYYDHIQTVKKKDKREAAEAYAEDHGKSFAWLSGRL